jgi:hypothetical protein
MKREYKSILSIAAVLILEVISLSAQDIFTINTLPFNLRDYDNFSPVYYKDGLVFCSNRSRNIFITRVDSLGKPLLDLFFVKKKGNQRWTSPSLAFKGLSTWKHEGPFTFSKDWKTIYITRNDGDYNEIFIFEFNGVSWGNPVPFQYNELNADVGHPCLSDDGKRLFFVSNKRGGHGGFDIYVTTFIHNHWTLPKNMGPEVNSSSDELFPYFHKNGRLYFASNRPNGYGGLDIYYTKEIKGKWIKPVLLPFPINTKYNDFAYVSDSSDRHGYISSDRNSRVKLTDIFEFNMNFPLLDSCKLQEKNDYTYVFSEQNSINTDTTTFLYEWDFGDGGKLRGKSLDVQHTFPSTGDYLVQLNVIDTLTGEIYMNQASYEFPVRDIEQPYITCRDTLVAGEEGSFDADKSYLPDKFVVNYYWDFGDETIARGKQIKHKYSEPGIYKVSLSISYTDSDIGTLSNVCRYRFIIVNKNP